ncbi:MAG TPA: hypothetical protein PKE04_14965 [Clostridia bacterium]|nr:hypothetical protein [Clostridia bacterium]
MRKMSFCMVLALIVCLSAVAMAATGETGELVNYDGSGFRIYDVEAITVIDVNTEYNGVKVADKPEMKQAVQIIASKLQEKIDAGELESVSIVGFEGTGTLEEQMALAVDKMGAAALVGSEEMTVYGADQLDAALSITSGIGYVMKDGVKVPYVRLVIKVVRPATGEYAGLSEVQRTIYENYTFIYNSQTKEFVLSSILTYDPSYVS